MKRKLKTNKEISVAVVLILVLALLAIVFLFPAKKWVVHTYNRMQAERTIMSQIKPLNDVLTSLGFENLSKLDTKCGDITYYPVEADQKHSGGTYFECSSGVDRYLKVHTDVAGKLSFNKNAAELSQILQANGWKSRTDYPTIPWFLSISQGVDYQPDQLNTKITNGFECIVDFFTAFSKIYNEEPAISLQIFCNKKPSGLERRFLD